MSADSEAVKAEIERQHRLEREQQLQLNPDAGKISQLESELREIKEWMASFRISGTVVGGRDNQWTVNVPSSQTGAGMIMIPTPPASGRYTLDSNDGVLVWIETGTC